MAIGPDTRIADRYVIDVLLAEGGMGSVYVARDERFERRVALKIARGLGSRLREIKDRFKREAQLGNELGQASGFVRAFDWGELDDGTGLYLAMDLIAGATPLKVHTGRVQERIDRLRRAALLVAEAHQRGILHRDIKPENFLHAPDGTIYLADFGLGKRFEDADEDSSRQDLTKTGTAMGTPPFMPPEQFDDAKNVDARADVYALGVMLFHALTGEYPYGRKLHEVAGRQQKVISGGQPVPSLRERAAATAEGLGEAHAQALTTAGEALDGLCTRALTLDPDRRLDSASAFAAGLAAFDPSRLGTDPDLAQAVAEAETLDLPPADSGPGSAGPAFAKTLTEPPPGGVTVPPPQTRRDSSIDPTIDPAVASTVVRPATRPDPPTTPPARRPTWVAPASAVAGLGVLVLGFAALRPSPDPPPQPTKTADPRTALATSLPNPEPSPSRSAQPLKPLLSAALDHAEAGRFGEAIEALRSATPAQRADPRWKDEGKPELARYRRLRPLERQFEAALTRGREGKLARLRRLLKTLEADHEGEPFADAWRSRAKAELGAAYERALRPAKPPTPPRIPAPTGIKKPAEPEVERRGSRTRRARFGRAITASRTRLSQAKARLTQKAASRLAATADERKRAAAASKRSRKGRWRKDRVVAYDRVGFKLLSGLKYSWDGCPPQLGYEVRRFATDPKDARAVFRLATYALRRGLFEQAAADFKRATKRSAALGSLVPDLAVMRDLVRAFRGNSAFDPKRPEKAIVCIWRFDQAAELRDVEPLHSMMQIRRARGGVSMAAPAGFLIVGAKLRGRWRGRVTLTVRVKTLYPSPFIVLWTDDRAYQLDLGPSISLRRFPTTTPRGGVGRTIKAGDLVQLELTPLKRGMRLRLSNKQGALLETRLASAPTNLQFGLGAILPGPKGARSPVVWDDIQIAGRPDPTWLAGVRVRGLGAIARRLHVLERTLRSEPSVAKVSLEFGAPKTSAEDPEGERGVSAQGLKQVADGREQLAAGKRWQATESFRRASGISDYPAAQYLYGRSLLEGNQHEAALILLDRAAAGIEDYYEAEAARAMALARLGRNDQARRAVDAALAIRPDYGPAYNARADLHVQEGRYDDALEDLELAVELSPTEPYARQSLERVRALVAGPAWAGRARESGRDYLLETDLLEDAKRLLTVLETFRNHYADRLPALVDKTKRTQRQAHVLVFSDPEAYYDYSERTTGSRAENTIGHFNPWSGQLLVLLKPAELRRPGGLHVMAHEGMHQWVHSQGGRLPFWANEGLAEYLAGVTLSPDHLKVARAGVVNAFLRKRLEVLARQWSSRVPTWFDLMTQSPAEFYAGNAALKYAQGWSIVHFILESGDKRLRETFDRYLRLLQTDDRKGARLEHLYVDTFHQLDMKDVQRRWEAWVRKLAASAKLPLGK